MDIKFSHGVKKLKSQDPLPYGRGDKPHLRAPLTYSTETLRSPAVSQTEPEVWRAVALIFTLSRGGFGGLWPFSVRRKGRGIIRGP